VKQGLVELIFSNEYVCSSSKLVALFVARYLYRNGEPLARPPVAKIARHCGMSRHTALRAVNQLAERQLMTKATVNGMRVFLFVGAWA